MLKVAVIGGGSTYTPELIKGFLDRHESFPLEELWLMDIDPAAAGGGGRLCQADRGECRFPLQGGAQHRPA